MVGDLANGRTVRSLAYLLTKYKGVKVFFVAPEVVRMKDDIKVGGGPEADARLSAWAPITSGVI